MKFNEIPYSRPSHEELLKKISDYTQELRSADNADKQIEILKSCEKAVSSFYTSASIAHVRNTIDTRDEFYDAERKYYDEIGPVITEKQQEFEKELLSSPFRKDIEEKLGSVLFINAEMSQKGFDPKIIPLMQEENVLTAQYQKLYASATVHFDGKDLPLPMLGQYKQSPDRAIRKAAYEVEGKFFDDHRAEFDEIFDKLIKNRTKQAQELGFDNFLELGYIRRQRNCYGPDDVKNYRKQVLEDLVPLVKQLKEKQRERIEVDSLKYYDDTFSFKDGNANPHGTPEHLLACAKQMYSEMSAETKEFIELMFDMDLFDVISKPGKAPGGYCTSFHDYHCPFIFSNFNGTSGDVDVLTHEAGHAFAFYTAMKEIPFVSLQEPSMEGCEVHSMSMEFLTSPWHHLFFEEETAKYQLAHAEDALFFIPYGTMVDYFQELVYTNPDWTPEQRNEAWAKLESEFRPYIDFDNLPFYGRGAGWQRQLHIYLYPFYYIDYCMAQTVALQVFAKHLKDEKDAWETYLRYTKMGGTKTFVDLVKTAGLISPLDNGCLKDICETIGNWINKQEL